MRPHGRARISRSNPEAQAVCDRCGARYTHKTLQWQFEWSGARLQNRRILVCPTCRDTPQENIRTIVLPPDPRPIANPRPEQFVQDNNPISPLNWSPTQLFAPPSAFGDFGVADFSPSDFLIGTAAANFGTLLGGGGVDAPFFGGQSKMSFQSATLSPSSSFAGTNVIAKNWSAAPGPVLPSSLGPVQQSYVVSQAIVTAPIDSAFLGASIPTTVRLDGSLDTALWVSLASAATLGKRGETVTLNPTSQPFYPFHRISVDGDGVHPVAIASIYFNTIGPSLAQQGSELGA